MKLNKTLFLSSAVAVALLLASCKEGKKEKIDGLKARIDKLKTENADRNEEIKKLEVELRTESGDTIAKATGKEIATKILKPQNFEHFVKTQGFIESIENIQVSSKSAGIITQVYAQEGETVTKGQVLGQVDNSLILRGIEELKSQLDLATTVFNRQKNLWDQKIGTEVQYLQSKSNKESLERRIASLNEQNEQTRIKSPINGVVDEVTLRVGQNIAPGMPAARVINNTDLKIKANVSEAFVSDIKKGDKLIVTISDINKEIETTVSFVGRNINQLSRSFVVEARLPSTGDVRPNMTAVAKIVFESNANVIVVPVNVIQDVKGEKVVYVAETQGVQPIAKRKTIEIAGVYDNMAQIKSGLKTGDELITVGYQGLNDGEAVKK